MYAKVDEIRMINVNCKHIGVKIIRTAEYPFYTIAVESKEFWQSLESFYNVDLPDARRLMSLLEEDKEKGSRGIWNYVYDKKCERKIRNVQRVKNSELRALIEKMI